MATAPKVAAPPVAFTGQKKLGQKDPGKIWAWNLMILNRWLENLLAIVMGSPDRISIRILAKYEFRSRK